MSFEAKLLPMSTEPTSSVEKGGLTGTPIGEPTESTNSQNADSERIMNTTCCFNLSDDSQYSRFDIFLHLFSVVTYVLDVGSDIWVAYLRFREENWWWFSLTMTFILVPSLTVTAFSLAWYFLEQEDESNKSDENDEKRQTNKNKNNPTSRARWASRLLFHILQLGPLVRYFETILYGCKSRRPKTEKKQQWYNLMLYESRDASLLRLIECYMEAAPQLVLQLYIMTSFTTGQSILLLAVPGLSCATSLCSMAWSLVSYHRANLMYRQYKLDMSTRRSICILGMTLHLFGNIFIIAARILSMALFASVFTFWVGVLSAAHFALMMLWIGPRDTNFFKGNQGHEVFYKVTMAALYIFAYMPLKNSPPGHRYIHYCIVYIENSIMILMWFFHAGNTLLAVLAVVVVLVGFLIGVALDAIYYRVVEPMQFNMGQLDISGMTILQTAETENLKLEPVVD